MSTTVERLMARLADYADILDRQYETILAGKSRDIAEISGLERRAALDIAALEKVVSRRADPGLARLRETAVSKNRRNRELLAKELLTIRKLLVARRLKLGTPSVYANAGQAALIDIST
jgi:hypothetical protein